MSLPWDDGVKWHANLLEDADSDALTVNFIRDKWLRSPNGAVEDGLIDLCIAAARGMFEGQTGRLLGTRTVELVLDKFPTGAIRLPFPPVISVTSIAYIDGDGVTQTLTGSPEEFLAVLPSGPYAGPAHLYPLYGESWPTARAQANAVTVTFEAGYAVDDTPKLVQAGMALVVGELYKQRSLSVQEPNNTPAAIGATRCWQRYRVDYAV